MYDLPSLLLQHIMNECNLRTIILFLFSLPWNVNKMFLQPKVVSDGEWVAAIFFFFMDLKGNIMFL